MTGSPGGTNPPPVVTLAGLYGTGVSLIGARAAEQLGVPCLDRQIFEGVAERLGVPKASVETYDPEADKAPRSRLRRFLDTLEQPATADTSAPDVAVNRLRSACADYLARATARGGVVVGRGGVVVLRHVPGALHVRLDGSRDARVEQAMRLFGLDRRTAERHRRENDRLRIAYVRDAYGVHLDDPKLFHLWIDGTVLDIDTCVHVIVTAARARTRLAAQSPRSVLPSAEAT